MNTPLLRNPACAGMPGIHQVQYIDIADVISIQHTPEGSVIVPKFGIKPSDIEADSVSAVSEYLEGQAFRHTADILYHGTATSADPILEAMTQRRFLIIYTDNDGTRWLLGTQYTPLAFTFSQTNDGEPDGVTAYNLHFEALCEMRATRIIA